MFLRVQEHPRLQRYELPLELTPVQEHLLMVAQDPSLSFHSHEKQVPRPHPLHQRAQM